MTPYPCYIKQCIGIQKTSIRMKNYTYNNVICFSLWGVGLRTVICCEAPWGRSWNTTPHCTLAFKSYPSLFFVENIKPYLFAFFWGHWSLFCTLSQLVERVCLPCGVIWGQSTFPPPVNLLIRCAKGWDCVLSLHCLSVFASLFLHCHFQVPCFSLKAFLKIPCYQNTTDRGLCSKQYKPTRV